MFRRFGLEKKKGFRSFRLLLAKFFETRIAAEIAQSGSIRSKAGCRYRWNIRDVEQVLPRRDRVFFIAEMHLDPRKGFFALRAGIGILQCRIHGNGFSCQNECFVLMTQPRLSPSASVAVQKLEFDTSLRAIRNGNGYHC